MGMDNNKLPLMEAYVGAKKASFKKGFLLFGGFVSASAIAVAGVQMAKKDHLFTLVEWNRAFQSDHQASNYLLDRNNYTTKVVDGDVVYYVDSSGSGLGLNESREQGQKDLQIKTTEKLKQAFFRDLDGHSLVSEDGGVHNSFGKSYFVPKDSQFFEREGIWTVPSTTSLDSLNFYNGRKLIKYFLGSDGTGNGEEVYWSADSAILSFMNVAGASYTFDGQTFNSVNDILTHFLANNVTYSDVSSFNIQTPYIATDGTTHTSSSIFTTENAALDSLKASARSYEKSLITDALPSQIDWEATSDFTTSSNDWITSNNTGSMLPWESWAKQRGYKLSDFMGTKDFFAGISENAWTGLHGLYPIYAENNPQSSLWQAFIEAPALGSMSAHHSLLFGDGTQAFTCSANKVADTTTPFMTNLRLLWNKFKLEGALPFDTEVVERLCMNNKPMYYAYKYDTPTGSEPSWYDDFFFSNWFKDAIKTLSAPDSVDVTDYRASAVYQSDYNQWAITQPRKYIWQANSYNTLVDAHNQIDNRLNLEITNTDLLEIVEKRGLIQYPGETTTTAIVKPNTTQLVSELSSTFHIDAKWTVNPGGNYITKPGVDWSAYGIDPTGMPTSGLVEITNFLTPRLKFKYGRTSDATKSFNDIVEYDNDLSKKIVVYDNYNSSGSHIFESITTDTNIFNEFVWDDLEKFKLAIKQTNQQELTKIILDIDHTEVAFNTITESMDYWLEKINIELQTHGD